LLLGHGGVCLQAGVQSLKLSIDFLFVVRGDNESCLQEWAAYLDGALELEVMTMVVTLDDWTITLDITLRARGDGIASG